MPQFKTPSMYKLRYSDLQVYPTPPHTTYDIFRQTSNYRSHCIMEYLNCLGIIDQCRPHLAALKALLITGCSDTVQTYDYQVHSITSSG